MCHPGTDPPDDGKKVVPGEKDGTKMRRAGGALPPTPDTGAVRGASSGPRRREVGVSGFTRRTFPRPWSWPASPGRPEIATLARDRGSGQLAVLADGAGLR